MHRAGCKRIFFGIESGTKGSEGDEERHHAGPGPRRGRRLCRGGHQSGRLLHGRLSGETTDSLIRSINFSSSLPLDYVSYTIAYPLPGTGFYERVRERRQRGEWHKVRHNRLLLTPTSRSTSSGPPS